MHRFGLQQSCDLKEFQASLDPTSKKYSSVWFNGQEIPQKEKEQKSSLPSNVSSQSVSHPNFRRVWWNFGKNRNMKYVLKT